MILLAAVALLLKAEWLSIQAVFQIFGANTVICAGVLWLQKAELKYASLETVLHIVLLLGTLILFGVFFHWFKSTPVWILVIMGIVIYAVSFF